MDKILEFINNKTNNKYQHLLFFDAIYNQQNDSLQLTFKNKSQTKINQIMLKEITQLSKLFVNDIVSDVNVSVKNQNFTLTEFKDTVKQCILNYDSLSVVELNDIEFNFDKSNVIIDIPVFENIEKLDFIKQDLQNLIGQKTETLVEINFIKTDFNNTDILEIRKERILEDNKIFEIMKKSQIVSFKVLKNLYNQVSTSKGIIAGNDVGVGQVTVVGNIKNLTEKIKATKTTSDDNSLSENLQQNQSKYITIELENDGQVTRSILFLKKDEETPKLNIGDTIVIEGVVNQFNNIKNIRIKSIATCTFEQPKQVWRNNPSAYRFVKPEPYISFEQSNFLILEEETKCEYLKNNTFVVYDLETTGISAETNDIIDIGAFKIVNGKIVEKFSTFINPLRQIPAEASKINRITNAMVENSPTIEQALPDFYKFCFGSTIVGYNNIGFDDLFIKKEGKKHLFNFDNKREDVMQLAKQYIKGLKNYKLSTVCAELDVQLIDAHRATNDALATAKLFIKIAEKFM